MESIFLDRLQFFIKEYENMKEILYSSEEVINEYLLSKIGKNDRIAIWGAGEHTQELLKLIKMDNINLVCFIDKSLDRINKTINDKKIISPNEIKKFGIDAIIISSYTFRKDIRKEIENGYSSCNIIDFYDKYNFGFPLYKNKLIENTLLYANTVATIYSNMKMMKYKIDEDKEKNIFKIIKENNLQLDNIIRESSILNENLLNQISGNKNLYKNRIKIDFFVQYPQGWTCIESVWNAFNQDDRFSARIIQIPFFCDSKNDSNYDIKRFFINSKIPFIPWYLYDINIENPDIIFYQIPYDTSRPEIFSSEVICKKIKVAYIPYSLEIGGGQANIKMQFDLNIHNNAWAIFARSERHKNMYKKYSSNKGKNVFVTGHPKIDAMYNLSKIIVDETKYKLVEGKKVFLWNPHFSIDPNSLASWSTFNIWKDVILDIFEKRKNSFLIIRPHPLLLEKLDEEDEGEIKRFKDRVRNMKNVFIDKSFDYRDSFLLSHALITDASSFLLEYLPTGKPILYLPKKDGAGLNDDEDIVQYYYIGDKSQNIIDFVDMVIKEQDPMKELRISIIPEYLGFSDSKTGERIKEIVLEKLKEDKYILK